MQYIFSIYVRKKLHSLQESLLYSLSRELFQSCNCDCGNNNQDCIESGAMNIQFCFQVAVLTDDVYVSVCRQTERVARQLQWGEE